MTSAAKSEMKPAAEVKPTIAVKAASEVPAASEVKLAPEAPPVPGGKFSEFFELYDLRVDVVGPADQPIYCGAKLGDFFELHGEMLKLPPGQGFSIYSLAALLPLLPAKQRLTEPGDWMSTDAEVACPDPHCPTRFRITRTGKRRFDRAQVTATALPGERA